MFYASSEINPQNPIWRDFPALNEYVTRCQSMLQSTRPDNDVLLYWPIYDQWQNPNGLRQRMQVENVAEWFFPTPVWSGGEVAGGAGVCVRLRFGSAIGRLPAVADGRIHTAGGDYAVVVVPHAKLMPLATLRKLERTGVTRARQIVFLGGLPSGPPGLKGLDEQSAWDELVHAVEIESATYRRETICRTLLAAAKVRCETWRNRRSSWRFIGGLGRAATCTSSRTNRDRRLTGGSHRRSNGDRRRLWIRWMGGSGWRRLELIRHARHRRLRGVPPRSREPVGIRLQLAPGQAVLVKTFRERVDGAAWSYRDSGWRTDADRRGVERGVCEWRAGVAGAVCYASIGELDAVSGGRGGAIWWDREVLDQVRAGCAGRALFARFGRRGRERAGGAEWQAGGTVIAPPYQLEIGPLADGINRLSIEVTSVAANRIRDLDRRGVKWKIFKDINFVNIGYKPFDASEWPVRDAGLLGPVTLTPLAETKLVGVGTTY